MKISYSFSILLCNKDLSSFLTMVRKLFKGGNYSRAEFFFEHNDELSSILSRLDCLQTNLEVFILFAVITVFPHIRPSLE